MKSIHNTLTTLVWLAAALIIAPIASYAQERIVFESYREGNNDIYSMKTDGSNPLRLTNNPAFDGEPSFSGDGSKIVFTSTRDGASNGEVYSMNADGTDQKRLTNSLGNDTHPALSPDGTKIAFISERAGGLELFIMNADGTDVQRLTFTSSSKFSPSFSPDGTKILYNGFDGHDAEIYIIDIDGANNINLTDNDADDRDAVFSPDGSKIAFQVYEGDWDIYTMNPDGSNRVNLTSQSTANQTEPTWSPDGGHIAYNSAGDIWAMTYGGAGDINLTSHPANDSHPTWSPANSAPVLEDLSVAPVNEGGTATLTGRISDANAGDSFTLIVSWGEGGAPDEFEYPAGTTSFEVTHVYKDDVIINTSSDDFQVILNVNDHRFGVDVKETSATVNNLDPTLSNLTIIPGTVTVGKAFELKGNFDDAGYHGSVQDEALSVTIDFGDGQVNENTNVAPGLIHIFHTYATVGLYTIKVKITDNDLGETIQTIPVVVSPPPPPVAPTSLRVDYIGANRIQLAWTDASDNETGFVIERCSSRGCGNFIQVGQASANATVYLDSNLYSNTQYYYRMRAFNQGGSSEYTSVVSAKTLRK